jgi:2,3-dimethylmalate lyase
MSAAVQLRQIFKRDEFIIAPGAYDALTARNVAATGFPVVYATGAGISRPATRKPSSTK